MELTAFAGWLNSAFAGYDSTILKLTHSMAEALGSVLTPVMKVITLLGEKGLVLILISLALMLFTRTRRAGVCMFGAIACGAILTNVILKGWVARPRPFESLTVYRQWWEAIGAPAEHGFSFPSGHVTAATAGLTALCLTRGRKWILPTVIWVLLMALSRNYLMAHFPSDVLFAVLIGLIAALIAYAITQLIFRLLEEHDDKAICAKILDFDLPLHLPGLRRAYSEDDEYDDDYDEESEEQPEDGDNYVLRYDDRPEEKVDVSATFDQIVRDNKAAKAGRTPAPEAEDELAEESEHVVLLSRFKRPSGNSGYQGKHSR